MRININQERKKYLFLLETPFNPDFKKVLFFDK